MYDAYDFSVDIMDCWRECISYHMNSGTGKAVTAPVPVYVNTPEGPKRVKLINITENHEILLELE